jgi:hypothetical protein
VLAFNNINLKTENEIYDYIQKEISLESRDSFHINNLNEIVNSGKGTIYEKIIIAQALLKRNGIESFMGLVFDNSREHDLLVMSENFCGFLLYVPSANKGTGEWLDFSEKYMPKGSVSNIYEGKSILIIDDDKVNIKKILPQNQKK